MRNDKGHLLSEFAVASVVATASVALSIAHAQAVRDEGDRIIAQQEENERLWRNRCLGAVPSDSTVRGDR